jgi:hypothetical protein
MKEFVRFSTTDVFVPVNQLSTRDLFYFHENLKIKQDILSWASYLVRSLDQRALWFPYSRLFFGTKCSRKCEFLSIWGVSTKSIVVSILDFFDTSLFRKMFKLLTCKRNHSWPCFDQFKIDWRGFRVFNFFSFGVWREKPL